LAANPPDSDPRSYCEALNSTLYKHWKSAMQEEYASLMENNVITLVKHTESKPIGCNWFIRQSIIQTECSDIRSDLLSKTMSK